MATKKKEDYEVEIDPRYTANTPRLAGRNDAAYQTEKAAQAAYDAVKGEGTPARFGTYKTPAERLAEQIASRENAAANNADRTVESSEPLNPHPLGDVDPIYQNAGQAAYSPADLAAAANSAPEAAGSKELLSQDYLDRLANRKDFSFNVNASALYQQYKDQYMRLGELAMKDTIGKSAALTGGYGNTYGQTAGQQVYNEYAARAADKIPELEQLAYERWRNEGEDMKDMYALLYGREQDQAAADFQREQFEYQQSRDAVADQKWASEFGLEADAQAWAQYMDERQMTLNEAKFFLEQEIERGNLDIAKANQVLKELEFKHNQQMDYISADQNQQKINLSWADLNSHINGSYYKGESSGNGSTTPKPGYNSDGTKKRTDKEVQAAADGLWKDYLKAEGSTKTLDTFMTRLLNQYSDDADRIMSTLENRAAAIDDRITRKGSKTYAYLD